MMISGLCVESLAAALYTAVAKDLPDVEYEVGHHEYDKARRTLVPSKQIKTKVRRPYGHECEVYHFPQTWGSTALGFGGIGGQAMTSAYTTVIMHGRVAVVYFAGRYAYKVQKVTQTFMDDLLYHNLCDVQQSGKYSK
jgi:hypothetical protein